MYSKEQLEKMFDVKIVKAKQDKTNKHYWVCFGRQQPHSELCDKWVYSGGTLKEIRMVLCYNSKTGVTDERL